MKKQKATFYKDMTVAMVLIGKPSEAGSSSVNIYGTNEQVEYYGNLIVKAINDDYEKTTQ